ncbi:MAG: hypothetical protein ACLFQM_02325 [Fidelibacterota bacterium]
MQHYKKIFLLILFFSLTNLWAFGDKYANSFLKNGTGVREVSLGGAVVSNASVTSSFYWNPALLINTDYISGRIMHAEEFAGVLNIDHVAVSFPNIKNYKIGIGFIRSAVDDIPLVKESSLIDIGSDGIAPGDENYPGPDADGTEGNGQLDDGEYLDFGKIGRFGTSESAFFLSVAKNHSDKIAYGLSVKTLYKDLYASKGFGVGVDFGLLYHWNDKINLGMNISDITTTYLFWNDGEKEVIAPEVRLGGSYHFILGKFTLEPMLGINATFDGEKNNSLFGSEALNVKAVAGLETIFRNQVSLRFGIDENENLHLGAGINTSLAALNYGLGFGGTYSALGNSHQLELTFNLENFTAMIKNNL